MDVLGKHFFSFVKDLGDCTMRSMFGGVGFFCEEAMFSLLIDEKLYIRGNHEIDDQFLALGCQRFRHVKKSVSVVINYFDVTELFEAEPLLLLPMIKNSILSATSERQLKNREKNQRIRDLPNMHITLERMLKKAGVGNTDDFFNLGAVDVFNRVNEIYGGAIDIKILWKLVGAEKGVHWMVLQESEKQQLREKVLY